MSADPILRPADAEQILSEIRENLAATPPGSGPVYLYPIAPIDTNTAEEDYLASNPDVAAAIQRGGGRSFASEDLGCQPAKPVFGSGCPAAVSRHPPCTGGRHTGPSSPSHALVSPTAVELLCRRTPNLRARAGIRCQGAFRRSSAV